MSYSRHYDATVHYSGTVRYSYPASEHGGTGRVSYEGTVPVGIDINVNTDPFDRSVRDTSASLNAVAGAVSAAEAAQVASVISAGKKISNTAIQGFFRVISSELSAQASESSSAMNSSVGLMLEVSQQVENIHQQMDGDFRAIKARYARVFDELDRELDRRIHELDRPAFQISSQGMGDVIKKPLVEGAAQVFMQTQDCNVTPLRISCARAKGAASDVLDELGDMCGHIASYSGEVAGSLDAEGGESLLFAPFVYAIERDVRSDANRLVMEGPNELSIDDAAPRVAAFVATSPEERWHELSGEGKDAIDQDFLRRVNGYLEGAKDVDDQARRERICQQMLKLYHQGATRSAYQQ